jgi:hypothetical protein
MGDTPFHRKGKRLLVEFTDGAGGKHTGWTRDLSFTGLFVVSDTLPLVGTVLTLNVHLPRGKVVQIPGRVVRQGRGSAKVTGSAPRGFGFELAGYSEDFTALVSTL